MATVIRLKRGGRTHAPYYRMVVVDSRAKITGRVIEEVGIYHPCARPEPRIEIEEEKILHWLGKGAQPSDTVRNILTKNGVMAKHAGHATAPAADAVDAADTSESEEPTETEAE